MSSSQSLRQSSHSSSRFSSSSLSFSGAQSTEQVVSAEDVVSTEQVASTEAAAVAPRSASTQHRGASARSSANVNTGGKKQGAQKSKAGSKASGKSQPSIASFFPVPRSAPVASAASSSTISSAGSSSVVSPSVLSSASVPKKLYPMFTMPSPAAASPISSSRLPAPFPSVLPPFPTVPSVTVSSSPGVVLCVSEEASSSSLAPTEEPKVAMATEVSEVVRGKRSVPMEEDDTRPTKYRKVRDEVPDSEHNDISETELSSSFAPTEDRSTASTVALSEVAQGKQPERKDEEDSKVHDSTPDHEMSSRLVWKPQHWLDLFFKICDKANVGESVRDFIADIQKSLEDGPVASKAMEAFLEDKSSNWASHCSKLDGIWTEYAPKLAEAGQCPLADLVKPSGPLLAPLAIVWHYPSFSSTHNAYGLVFDTSNPCLNLQQIKIGSDRRVLTVDAIPKRMFKPESGNPYDGQSWWKNFQSVAVKFLEEVTEFTKIRLVLGKENNAALHVEMKKNKSTLLYTSIPILIDDKPVQLYGKEGSFYVVQCRATKKIKQLIFTSYHLEYFMYNYPDPRVAKFCDISWNICAAVAGLDVVNVDYFEFVAGPVEEEIDWLASKWRPLPKLIKMIRYQKEHGPIDDSIVRKVYATWLGNPANQQYLNPSDGSLADQLIRAFQRKGQAHRMNPTSAKAKEAAAQAAFDRLAADKRLADEARVAKRESERSFFTHHQRSQQSGALAGYDAKLQALIDSGMVAEWKRLSQGPGDNRKIKGHMQRARHVEHLVEKGTYEEKKRFFQNVFREFERKTSVIFYSSTNPDGLRFDGDGGPRLP